MWMLFRGLKLKQNHEGYTHHTHRRQRTILCIGPGSQPEAWLSLHQHRILNKTQYYDQAEFDPGSSFREQSSPSVWQQIGSVHMYTHFRGDIMSF